MVKIFIINFLFLSTFGLACSIRKASYEEPPKFINGEWVKTTNQELKKPKTDYKKLFNSHSIVFSGTVSLAYVDNKDVSNFIYTDEVWKGHVLKYFEENKRLSVILDMGCPIRLTENKKYIFFANTGTRKNPINVMKVFFDDKEFRREIGKPIKRWIEGEIHSK